MERCGHSRAQREGRTIKDNTRRSGKNTVSLKEDSNRRSGGNAFIVAFRQSKKGKHGKPVTLSSITKGSPTKVKGRSQRQKRLGDNGRQKAQGDHTLSLDEF